MKLTVEDHTKIMEFVQQNPWLIIKQLGIKKYVLSKSRPTQLDVIRALADVDEMPRRTKRAVLEILKFLPKLEDAQRKIAPAVAKQTKKLDRELQRQKSVNGMIKVLERKKRSMKANERVIGLDQGLAVAVGILKDGKGRIY